MSDKVPRDDLITWLLALFNALAKLAAVSRYFHPPAFEALMSGLGRPDGALREAVPGSWPDAASGIRAALDEATGHALAGWDELRAAEAAGEVYRALRHLPRAEAALYPLAAVLKPVSRFFLPDDFVGDHDLVARLAAPRPGTGVFHFDDGPGQRGGYSLYVPEYLANTTQAPLVMALHGGSGNGRGFLWSWLRAARAAGAILVAPTAIGPTWALMGEDPDSPNLARILDAVRASWAVDPARMLLAGMSDGGTFCYVSGLRDASPFTHLAPCSASFHPLLAQLAGPERLGGLSIRITHGALDWMFPAATARAAAAALEAAGARVSYREIEDLSHCYPRELPPALLSWLDHP